VFSHAPVLIVQSLTKPSPPTEMSCIPAVMKETFKTEAVCPSNVFRQEKSVADQILTVLSAEAVARALSTGEN